MSDLGLARLKTLYSLLMSLGVGLRPGSPSSDFWPAALLSTLIITQYVGGWMHIHWPAIGFETPNVLELRSMSHLNH